MSAFVGALHGQIKRATGTSGTLTLNSGARVLQIHAIPVSGSAGSVQIFNDTNPVTLPAGSGWWGVQENHGVTVVPPAPNNTIVFTTTAAYYVEYVDTAGRNATAAPLP